MKDILPLFLVMSMLHSGSWCQCEHEHEHEHEHDPIHVASTVCVVLPSATPLQKDFLSFPLFDSSHYP